jgi:hypothetical protein
MVGLARPRCIECPEVAAREAGRATSLKVSLSRLPFQSLRPSAAEQGPPSSVPCRILLRPSGAAGCRGPTLRGRVPIGQLGARRGVKVWET